MHYCMKSLLTCFSSPDGGVLPLISLEIRSRWDNRELETKPANVCLSTRPLKAALTDRYVKNDRLIHVGFEYIVNTGFSATDCSSTA